MTLLRWSVILSPLLVLACPAPPGEGEGEAVEGEGEEGEGEEGEGEAGEGEGEGEDVVAPTITLSAPANGALDVAPNLSAIVVTWSEPIDCASATAAGVALVQGFTSTVVCNNNGADFQLQLTQALPVDTIITWGIVGSGVVVDLAGNAMVADDIRSFRTAAVVDNTAPDITSRSPGVDQTGVATNTNVAVGFSEPVSCGTIAASLRQGATLVATTTTCTPDASGGALGITVQPDAALAADTVFSVTIAGAVADLAGNTLGADDSWDFTTAAGADLTPPAAPTTTAPADNSRTFFSQVDITGTKDADGNIELRKNVNGNEVFAPVVGVDGLTSFATAVDLTIGANTFELRSRDGAGNVSGVVSLILNRDANPVNAPVIAQIVNNVDVAEQVVEGTRDAQTAVLLNGVQIVAAGASTTWVAEITASAGLNVLRFTARDAAANVSLETVENVTFTAGAQMSVGEVRVQFDVISMFNQIGDESSAVAAGNTDLNHSAYMVWVEGPLADNNGTPERCHYDAPNFQRQFTRHVKTIAYSTYNRPPRNPGNGCNLNSKTAIDCNGFVWEPESAMPNFLAALVETGRWNTNATPQRLAPTADRRDAFGRYHQLNAGQHFFSAPQMMFVNAQGIDQPRVLQAPVIDGLTQASVNPHHLAGATPTSSCSPACGDNQHCVDADTTFQAPSGGTLECRSALPGAFSTCAGRADCGTFPECDTGQGRCEDAYGVPVCKDGSISVDVGGTAVCRPESLLDWRERKTFTWDLTNSAGTRVRAGWYAIWVELAYDRSNPGGPGSPGQAQWSARFLQTDLETCWDDASHDVLGQHRAVALVYVDGSTSSTQFVEEKGKAEPVPTCNNTLTSGTDNIKCSCGASTVWPCPALPNTLAGSGQDVHLLDPDFEGGAGAVKVEYCAGGACP